MTIYKENFYYTQKLWKQANDKTVKPKNYILDNKVWLNNKYIKTKQNHKLGVKFFSPFWVLYPLENQAYKHKLPKK